MVEIRWETAKCLKTLNERNNMCVCASSARTVQPAADSKFRTNAGRRRYAVSSFFSPSHCLAPWCDVHCCLLKSYRRQLLLLYSPPTNGLCMLRVACGVSVCDVCMSSKSVKIRLVTHERHMCITFQQHERRTHFADVRTSDKLSSVHDRTLRQFWTGLFFIRWTIVASRNARSNGHK